MRAGACAPSTASARPSPTVTAHRAALLAVFVGGALGSVARVALIEAIPIEEGRWPWATLIANVAGSALLGYLTIRLAGRRDGWIHPALGPGLCGGLTTFSAVQIEILLMLDDGRAGLAGAYLGASVAACLVAATASARLAERRAPA